MEKRSVGARKAEGTTVIPGTEFIVNFGDRVEASCVFDYSGPPGNFTFAFEIGHWHAAVFTEVDRWEISNIYVAQGTGKRQKITFTINAVSGLILGTVYDLNWEIGKGSKETGSWHLIERLITNDVIRIASAPVEEFKNLSVSFKKV